MFRLFVAIGAIAFSGFLSLESWPLQGLLMVSFWAAAAMQGAKLDQMLRRLALFLPFVLAIGLGVPATQADGGAWNWTLTIVGRSLVAFFAGIWLVQVLPFQELRDVLKRLGTPAVFLDSLAFMHRYAIVLWEELSRLQTARRARSSRLTWVRTWTTSAQLIGELLIRAWDRAEHVHRAMLARGGNQDFGGSS